MSALNVYIPYSDFTQLQQDSAKLSSVIAILNTEFPDDTCQLIAIKSVLGLIEEKEEPVEPEEPVIPDTPEEPEEPDETPDDSMDPEGEPTP